MHSLIWSVLASSLSNCYKVIQCAWAQQVVWGAPEVAKETMCKHTAGQYVNVCYSFEGVLAYHLLMLCPLQHTVW
jgi:hypothetical protein